MSKLILNGAGPTARGQGGGLEYYWDVSAGCPPSGWGGTAVCWSSLYCVGRKGTGPIYTAQWVVYPLPAGPYTQWYWKSLFYSRFNAGWGVGAVTPYYWNGSGWTAMCSGISFTSAGYGVWTSNEDTRAISEPGGRNVLVQIEAQGGQFGTNPYGINMSDMWMSFT